MPDITEYGDLMINAVMDEWGFRKIDGLLEDGTKIIILVGIFEKSFSDAGLGSEAFTNPFRAMTFADEGLGTDVFALLRELAFSDVGVGSDSFVILFRALGFSDAGLGYDVFSIPFRAMKFQDSGLGTDVWKGANLIEAPLVIVTAEGKIILRISRATKKQPDYMFLVS